MSKLKPIQDVVLVTEDTFESKTGLFVPEGVTVNVNLTGTVAAVGPSVTSVTEGEKVLLKPLKFLSIVHEGSKYLVLRENEVIARIV
ncbi:MAG: co-chaperone GroES family protein [Legionella sp.]|uniref:co-chaperone GroES family protein n=1 Tax=Legionella sp. TaxID=459 RepID=UPI00284300C6|nr:co-chaperone GroES family protein [Legionella sp.]